MNPLAARIHAELPQTQCTRCGFPDCAGYAQAIVDGDAGINQCPPGGAEGVQRLAALTGQAALPLNPVNGTEGPRSLAVIDEAWCIGCTLCLDACPTDAIFGSNKRMHTVIEPHCTGCALCIPVCPVDCIAMENASGERTGWQAWSPELALHALQRYQFHSKQRPLRAGKQPKMPETSVSESEADARRRAVIEQAVARAKALRGGA